MSTAAPIRSADAASVMPMPAGWPGPCACSRDQATTPAMWIVVVGATSRIASGVPLPNGDVVSIGSCPLTRWVEYATSSAASDR